MNKYKEALNNIKDCLHIVYDKDYGSSEPHLFNQALETIQELVDKETPMKLRLNVLVDDWITTVVHCGKCDRALGTIPIVNNSSDYCRYCNQKIDWNDEDE